MPVAKSTAVKWRLEKPKPGKQIRKLPNQQVLHQRYYPRYNNQVDTASSVFRKFQKLKIEEELTLIKPRGVSMPQEETTIKYKDYRTPRQIHYR